MGRRRLRRSLRARDRKGGVRRAGGSRDAAGSSQLRCRHQGRPDGGRRGNGELRAKLTVERGPVALFDRGFLDRSLKERARRTATKPRSSRGSPSACSSRRRPGRRRRLPEMTGCGRHVHQVGYSSPSFSAGLRPAVLVVDFQLAFTDPRWPLGGLPLIHAARDRTADLLKRAREKDVPVAACYTAYGSLADMPFWKVKPVRDEFFYGDPCTAMDPSTMTSATSRTARTRHRCFPDAADHVPGQATCRHGDRHRLHHQWLCARHDRRCVLVRFPVPVPDECCGDAEEGPHRANLADVGRRYADVTTRRGRVPSARRRR